MADIGQWSGGTTTLLPTTTFTAPNGMFPTQDRNDASYSFDSTTSTLTLPSDADGYLITAAFEFVDTSNGRCNPQGRLVLSSGSGNFVGTSGSGYDRNNADDTAYVRAWAIVDNPSSAEVQFQWRRDSDAPTGGTESSFLQVIPLYYSNVGLYQSTQAACNGSTTPTSISGFTSVVQSDTSAIEIASGQTVSTKNSGKRYLVLGGQYWQGIGAARTQRWMGLSVNSTFQNDVRSNSYGRDGNNSDIGEIFTTIVEGANSLESQVFLGEALGSFPSTGAAASGNTTGSNANHVIAVLELNDGAEVFKGVSGTQQNINSTARTAVEAFNSTSLLDTNSFSTNATTTSITAEDDFDVLLGANLSGGYTSSSGQRYTGFSKFTVDGVEQDSSISGDFARGSQGSQSTFGYSSNMLSSHAVSDTETLGVNIGRIVGGQAGTVNLLSGYTGMWGINLDTLEPTSNNVVVDPQDLVSDTELDSRSITSSLNLSTLNIESATEVLSRTLSSSLSLSLATINSLTEVQDRALVGEVSIPLGDITSNTEVSDRALGGDVSIARDSIGLLTEVDTRSIGGSTPVDLSDLTASTEVSSRSLSSGFELNKESLELDTSVLSNSLTIDTVVSKDDLSSSTQVQSRSLLSDVLLEPSAISSQAEVSDKTLSASVITNLEGVQADTVVGSRFIILPIPTPPDRVVSVPAENRVGNISFESRVFKVDLSDRDLTVDSRSRVFLVPKRTRTFKT